MTFPSFFVRRGMLLGAILSTAALVAACAPADTGNGGTGGDAGGGTATVSNGVVELSAADLAFDASTIEAPAGEAFTIRFTNDDTVPHNVSVYTEEGGTEIAKGEVIDGGQTTEVTVDALEPGEYFFVCDVHPDMTGTVVVEG